MITESPSDRFRRIDAAFGDLLDLPDDERSAFIERFAGDDSALRAELRELLEAHRRSGDFLEAPLVRLGTFLDEEQAPVEALPERIGPFRVIRALGQGGMGRVYLGVRGDGQFEQRVALKVLREPTPGLLRRFLEERRILAMLEHPGIARFIDGGLGSDGLPWIALEYVEGEPIDQYCASRQLPLEDRIALIAQVCEAASYAHQHLVIHRDLKPSNILVTPTGRVKLLDFGIAKLLAGPEASPIDTRTEFRALTPEYAAPEQVRGGPISTATDVYALGVLIYRLLTGDRPYDLRGRSPAEIEHIVCEFEPPMPSTRAPAPLHRRLRGDLDLIVMTALQKRAERRYQSPAALAQELERYRSGLPILARPDSAVYRVRRFVGRHRAGVAAAALLAALLAGSASRERVLRHRAEVQARKATAVEGFLLGVFDVADPFARAEPDGGQVTARELLDRGAARIDSTLRDQPEVQAELRSALGRVYTSLGLYDRATPLLRQALDQQRARHGDASLVVARDMDLLGAALEHQDDRAQAEPLLREALALRRRLAGGLDSSTAESVYHLATLLENRNEYDEAEALHREALDIRRAIFGDTAVIVAMSLNNLALMHYRRGRYAEAEPLYRQALEIEVRQRGGTHPTTAQTMANLAQVLQARGNVVDAERWYREALEAKRASLGNLHPGVTITLNNLGNLLARDLGRVAEGEALTREALALDRQLFGNTHSFVAQSLGNLGVILRMKGEFTEAEQLMREALAINRSLYRERHQSIGTNYNHLALLRWQLGDDAGAVSLMRRSLEIYRTVLGDRHQHTLVATGNLARLLVDAGEPGEAEPLVRGALEHLDPENARHRVLIIGAERTLGDALRALGRHDEARPILARAVEAARTKWGTGDHRTADAELALGRALMASGDRAAAAPLVRSAHATLQRLKAGQPRLAAEAERVSRRLSATPQG